MRDSRRLLVVATLAALVMQSGCTCDGRVTTNETFITFEFPTDGSVLSATDDVNPSTPGIQVNVRALVQGLGEGATVTLTNSVDLESTGAPIPTDSQVHGGVVTFPGYTVPSGDFVLRVALPSVPQSAVCDTTQCDEVRVTALEKICQFTTPRDGDVLTTDQYPNGGELDPFEADVVVDCLGLAPGELVAMRIVGSQLWVVPVDESGRITFAQVALEEGPNQLEVAAATDSDGNNPAGAVVRASVSVETGRCTARLAPRDRSKLLASDDADADPDNGVMHANLTLETDCASDSTIELYVQAPGATELALVTPQSVTPDPLGGAFKLNWVPLPESVSEYDVQVVARVSEPSGGSYGVSLRRHYWVDSIVPKLLSVSPAAASCLGPVDDSDQDMSNGLQPYIFGKVFGSEDGAEIWVRAKGSEDAWLACGDAGCGAPAQCRATYCRNVATITGGDFSVSDLTLPAGASTLEYVALDRAGNQSAAHEVDVDSFQTPPSAVIIAPAEGARIGLALDEDPSTDGIQYTVDLLISDVPLTVGDLEVNGEVLTSGQQGQPFAPEAGTNVPVSVTVTLGDGPRTLRVRVPDPCGGFVDGAPVNIIVSSEVPPLTVTAYEAGNFANRVAIPDGGVTGAAAADLDVYTGIADVAHDVTVRAYTGFVVTNGVRACDGAVASERTTTVAVGQGGALLTNVPLAAGINCFTVTATDPFNEVATTLVVSAHRSVPAIAITSPANDATLTDADADATNGVNTTVTVSFTPATDTPGELELLVGPAAAPYNRFVKSVAVGTTTLSFAAIGLAAGDYDLTARFTDLYGTVGTSASVHVTVTGSGGPRLVIASPLNGAVISNSNFQVLVTALETRSVDWTCSLRVDGASVATGSWVASAPSLTLDAALAEGARQIVVACNDGAGGTDGYSQLLDLTIDDTAPAAPTLANEDPATPGALRFDVAGAFINGFVTDGSSFAGLQHDVGVLVPTPADANDDWRLELSVTPSGGTATTYTQKIVRSGDPSYLVVRSVDFGAVDGNVSFSAVVFDAANNPSAAATATLVMDRTPPVIVQQVPNPASTMLTHVDDMAGTADMVDLAFAYRITGAASGSSASFTVEPPPYGITGFPRTATITSNKALFPMWPFEDGNYTATLTADDAAGNVGTYVWEFTVQNNEPQIEWGSPAALSEVTMTRSRDTDAALAGLQLNFTFLSRGLAAGTPVVLCSTVAPPAGGGAACRWGSDGLGGLSTGVVIGTGVLVGSTGNGSVTLRNVTVAEGAQILHAEAREIDGNPDVPTSFVDYVVDSVPPVVTALTIPANNASNDAGGVLRLTSALSEGTVSGSSLRVGVHVTATGAVEGARVQILSSYPTANTVVGTGTLDAALEATVTAVLAQGAKTLRARVYDNTDMNFANVSDPLLNVEPEIPVIVDFSAGYVTVPAALANPYTGRAWPVEAAGAAGHTDDVLRVDVVVSVSDNLPLTGGTVTLGRYDASDVELYAATPVVLSAGQQSVTFAGFPLLTGSNRLRATFVDAAGNRRNSTVQVYNADLYGPILNLSLRDAASATLACDAATVSTACDADLLPPVNGLSRLDTTAADNAYCPPLRASPGYQGGTRLFYSLSECANASGIESCNTTVRLESRLAGTDDPFTLVQGGTLASTADQVAQAEYTPVVAFPPGQVRELRLVAVDQNGNVGLSNTVFLKLDQEGVLVQLERIRDGASIGAGDIVLDDRHFGRAENEDPSDTSFYLDLRAHLTVIGTSTPTELELSVDGGGPLTATVSGSTADFDNVVLPWCNGWPDEDFFTIIVSVNCGATADCATRTYSGLVADKTAPVYEFDRCSLCRLGVPLVDSAAVYGTDCATCASATDYDAAEKIAPSPAAATWSIAGDQDGDPSNGFSIGAGTSPQPLVAILSNVEPGTSVKLVSTQGALAGATVTVSDCVGSKCEARWSGLHLPSLPGSAEHVLSLSFTDAAGNAGAPDVARAPEQIHARVDTIPPADVDETICIGESTTPSIIADPASDPRTYESPICAEHCAATGACSRRQGRATVVWQAPADDGASGDRVSSYEIIYAALGIRYKKPDTTLGTAITDCTQMAAANGVEGTIPVAPTTDPGGIEHAAIDNLYPHRSYCFRVQGIDDLGNRAAAGSAREERVIPLLTYPGVSAFAEWDQGDAGTVKDDFEPAAGLPTTFSKSDTTNDSAYGTNIGDINGDGRADFALRSSASENGVTVHSVLVFMSRADQASLLTPFVSIRAPAVMVTSFIGIAGGDFDNDGYSDLALCGYDVNTTSGTKGGANGGALYLYYGGPNGIRADDNPSGSGDPMLPGKIPDVALFGPADAHFCSRVLLAEVNGEAGADLIVTTAATGMVSGTKNPRVYGFFGGGRSRFPGSPPATTKVWLDLSAVVGGSNQADFAIHARTKPLPVQFPEIIEAADVDGDGTKDLLVGDSMANHDLIATCDGCGEVYVYKGGPLLVGAIAGGDLVSAVPDPAPPPQLMQVLRFAADTDGNGTKDSALFGRAILGVASPEGPTMPAWVVIRARGPTISRYRAVVFQGKAGVGLVPPGSVGHTGVYPVGGLPFASYAQLDPMPWNSSTTAAANFGAYMADVGEFDGHGGRDILVSGGGTGTTVFMYSFNPEALRFDKRLILYGADGFGMSVVGIGGYLGTADEPQILVTRGQGSAPSPSRVFVFR